jgi:hypothetical protein
LPEKNRKTQKRAEKIFILKKNRGFWFEKGFGHIIAAFGGGRRRCRRQEKAF